ncbi:unnamed protein product [Nezara viridula]|uniref:Uncharacterized protein n=1 Tax=Nezara viridula TaxID=85310 RepID=A0A9P0MK58_NEZVI|nr:unnamed protein product [Nezara viridula]
MGSNDPRIDSCYRLTSALGYCPQPPRGFTNMLPIKMAAATIALERDKIDSIATLNCFTIVRPTRSILLEAFVRLIKKR